MKFCATKPTKRIDNQLEKLKIAGLFQFHFWDFHSNYIFLKLKNVKIQGKKKMRLLHVEFSGQDRKLYHTLRQIKIRQTKTRGGSALAQKENCFTKTSLNKMFRAIVRAFYPIWCNCSKNVFALFLGLTKKELHVKICQGLKTATVSQDVNTAPKISYLTSQWWCILTLNWNI